MCGPSQPQDNSAEIARQKEEERQARINQGKANIDSAFSIFDPKYYDKFQKDYLDYYNPQVDDQFTDARQGLRYNLARAGIEDSTAGQKAFGNLTKSYGDQRQAISSKALEASNQVKTQVEQNKSDLYSQNIAAADPSLSAISAAGRAGALQSPPSFSPLADVFAGSINAGAGALYGSHKALPTGYRGALSGGAPMGRSPGYTVGS